MIISNEQLRKEAEKMGHSLTAKALYNNLIWWAEGNHEYYEPELIRALSLLEQIVLNDYKDYFVVNYEKGSIFYRAREINLEDYGDVSKGIGYSEKRLHGYNWDESKEPPEDKSRSGRNNKEKEQALYLAADEITAAMEIKSGIRKLISIAKFELNEDLKVIDFSKLHYPGPMDIKDAKYGVDTREFLANIISLYTSPVQNGNYLVTQKLTRYFREKGYSAFSYRSFFSGGTNYTIFDQDMKKFVWQDSRVLLNYAVSNLFISLDKEEGFLDIRNESEVLKDVEEANRDKMFRNLKTSMKNLNN